MSESLKSKTIKGAIWSAIQKFGMMGISFIANMILARQLSPSDFGCIAMLAIFLVVADTFMDGGLGSALIQRKELSRKDTSTVFYFNISVSIVLYCILFFSAKPIANFYDITLLESILQVQGIVLIINSFAVVQNALMRKEMAFKKLAVANITASITSLTAAITLAFLGFGVWALVYQQIILSAVRVIMLWFQNTWRPTIEFSKESLKGLFGFGSFIFLSNLLNNLGNNVQGVIIGKAFNAGILGYYSQAKKLEEMASSTFSNIIDSVSYPALAMKQDDPYGLVIVLRKFVKAIAFFTFPLMAILILTGEPIITLCYGKAWLDSVKYFQILCVAGLAICLQGINYYAVASIGKSKSLFIWTIIKRIIGIALLLLGLLWGMNGLLICIVINSYLMLLANQFQVQIYLGYTIIKQLMDIFPIFLGTLIAGITSYYLFYSNITNIYIMGLFSILSFTLVYLIYSRYFSNETLMDLIQIFKNRKQIN